MLRTGVIGVGRMGQHHCRIYSNTRKTKLVGVCDINPKVGAEIARKYEVPCFESFDQLLNFVDVVTIATPTQLHYDLAMRCLDRGVHVLIEKPFTETVGQAEDLISKAEQTGLVVQVGYIERFNPTYLELKKVIEDQELLAISFRRLSPFQNSNTDVDVVLDLMTHDLALVHDMFGGFPDKLSAHGLSVFTQTIDHAVAQLPFLPAPLLSLTASRVTENKVRAIEVITRNAFIEANLLDKNISVHRHSSGEYLNHNTTGVKYRQESIIERILVPNAEPLRMQIEHFIQCVEDHTTPAVSAQAGYEILRISQVIRDLIIEQFSEVQSPVLEVPVPV